MDQELTVFRVYEPASGSVDTASEIRAADIFDAARLFIEQLPNAGFDTEVAVISPNGIESLFGYRQTIPQAHLDD